MQQNYRLPSPPAARRLAGRIMRTHNAGHIQMSVPDQHACKEALVCGFVGDQLRRRLVGLWQQYGTICLAHEDKKRRRPEDDALDALIDAAG